MEKKLDKNVVRRLLREYVSANILGVELIHNGHQGGDAGHGGFVEITFTNEESGVIYLNGKELFDTWESGYKKNNKSFTIRLEGSTERDTFIKALKFIVQELEENSAGFGLTPIYDTKPISDCEDD